MIKDKKHLEQTKTSVVNLAKTRYMDKWLFYFHDAKTKKEVWVNNQYRIGGVALAYSKSDWLATESLCSFLSKDRKY